MERFPKSATYRGRRLALAIVAAASAAACSSGNDTPAVQAEPPAPAAPTSSAVPVRVVDGPVGNALVCLDVDGNGACGTGEPTARTDASGNATLDVPAALVGKHPVLALVGTDAVDADTGPVTVPFAMSAPADRASLVTPLTTLQQAYVAATGSASADAETYVKDALGLSGSLTTDYSAAGADAAAERARLVARVAVLVAQQQYDGIRTAAGTSDGTGGTITAADLQSYAFASQLDALPALAAAASAPAAQDPATRAAALSAAATRIVAAGGAATPAEAVAAISLQKQIAQSPDPIGTPVAGASLRMFTFTDPANWFFRLTAATEADATPDASGTARYYDLRRRATAGDVVSWALGTSYARRGDLFWNGSAWTDCPLGTRGATTVRDAAGRSSYVFCGGFSAGTTQRSATSIAGRTMSDVVAEIRAFPGRDANVPYSSFGPTNLALLGGATFPPGSTLQRQRSVETLTTYAYDVTLAPLAQADAPIAAGGDATANPAPPCAAILANTPFASYSSQTTTLERLAASYRGTPCRNSPAIGVVVNGIASGSGPRNEWWSNSTVSIGTVANGVVPPAGTGAYYTTTRDIRYAFTGPGDAITWYDCLTRTTGGTGRNCDPVGTGRFTVTTLGDARVMSFSNPPLSAAALSYEHVLIERGGTVRAGYRNKTGTSDGLRLNLVAANAMFVQLGLPAFVPQ